MQRTDHTSCSAAAPETNATPTQQTHSCSDAHYAYQRYDYDPTGFNGPGFMSQTPSTYSVSNLPVYGTHSSQFWKGALIGAGIALLLGNETVQKSLMKGATSLFNAAQAGVEEIKEKFEDIRAEMNQPAQEKKE